MSRTQRLLSKWIHPSEFKDRRHRLSLLLDSGDTAVVAGQGLQYREPGGVIFHEFHQASHFAYLTGLGREENCAMALTNHSNGNGNGGDGSSQFTLFVPQSSKKTQIWDGPRITRDQGIQVVGADVALSIGEFQKSVSESIMARSGLLYTNLSPGSHRSSPVRPASANRLGDDVAWVTASLESMGIQTSAASAVPNASQHSSEVHDSFYPIQPLVDKLRLFKSPAEIACLREAGRITGRAFQHAMRDVGGGTSSKNDKQNRSISTEYGLWASLEFHCRTETTRPLAYVPVVASGPNALVLHYVRNNSSLTPGDLVLVDAGADLDGYCADVTRTFPVSGRFTPLQLKLYRVVLDVQQRMTSKCSESQRVSLNELQLQTQALLREGLENHVLNRPVSIDEMDTLYPHHVGHYLGMDVHDTPTISRNTRLKHGMVVTIEPGLYIPDSSSYPEGLRGLGVRIEDDVAVGGPTTNDAPIVLSVEAPKQPDDIEAVMNGVI